MKILSKFIKAFSFLSSSKIHLQLEVNALEFPVVRDQMYNNSISSLKQVLRIFEGQKDIHSVIFHMKNKRENFSRNHETFCK